MTILNRTTKASERYRLIRGSMGCYGLPKDHPNHHWMVVSGTDRGNGYQNFISVSYFLAEATFPDDAKITLRRLLAGACDGLR